VISSVVFGSSVAVSFCASWGRPVAAALLEAVVVAR